MTSSIRSPLVPIKISQWCFWCGMLLLQTHFNRTRHGCNKESAAVAARRIEDVKDCFSVFGGVRSVLRVFDGFGCGGASEDLYGKGVQGRILSILSNDCAAKGAGQEEVHRAEGTRQHPRL